mmetsp:Transcript_55849/g.130701  ORF Transcript_55849/g.130701 Transcript_55849/m.130701 type:complete len:212 (+) Transcript_55849:124-759(+)
MDCRPIADSLSLDAKLPAPAVAGPVLIANPDGTLVEGVPRGYKEDTPPSTPRAHISDFGMPVLISADVVRVLARHETLFLSLLLMQFIVEIGFEIMHVKFRVEAIFELSLIYPSLSMPVLTGLYWATCMGESVFCAAYYSLGVCAACTSRPRLYHRFSTVALVGTLGQLPLAYLNRFNLLIFFLRFIAYAYARFQWNLLIGISLLREDMIP